MTQGSGFARPEDAGWVLVSVDGLCQYPLESRLMPSVAEMSALGC